MYLSSRISSLFIKRQIHVNTEIVENCRTLINRNPRNLERLRIARKPIGYGLDKPGFSYWHKLFITRTQRYVTAGIHHMENGLVISASSQEWGIRKQLYSTHDNIAYKYVGRVLAQRCLECGICEIYIDDTINSGNKVELLINELKENGIILEEPKQYKHPKPTDRYFPEKPWETYE